MHYYSVFVAAALASLGASNPLPKMESSYSTSYSNYPHGTVVHSNGNKYWHSKTPGTSPMPDVLDFPKFEYPDSTTSDSEDCDDDEIDEQPKTEYIPQKPDDDHPQPETQPQPHYQPTPKLDNPPSNGTSWEDDFLKLHNDYRAKHQAPPLTWDSTIASHATGACQACVMEHSQDGQYGENLAMGQKTPQEVVGDWYDEVKMYSFSSGAFSSATGHFTQVVWKSATKLGCGWKKCGGSILWACNYDVGNVQGQFQENVLPSGGGAYDLPSDDKPSNNDSYGSSSYGPSDGSTYATSGGTY